jgi:hypothetical protein
VQASWRSKRRLEREARGWKAGTRQPRHRRVPRTGRNRVPGGVASGAPPIHPAGDQHLAEVNGGQKAAEAWRNEIVAASLRCDGPARYIGAQRRLAPARHAKRRSGPGPRRRLMSSWLVGCRPLDVYGRLMTDVSRLRPSCTTGSGDFDGRVVSQWYPNTRTAASRSLFSFRALGFKPSCGCSSVGRASASQAEGRRFEPGRPL